MSSNDLTYVFRAKKTQKYEGFTLPDRLKAGNNKKDIRKVYLYMLF